MNKKKSVILLAGIEALLMLAICWLYIAGKITTNTFAILAVILGATVSAAIVMISKKE